MGAIRCLFNETERRFIKVGSVYEADLVGTRKIQASALRYCLQGSAVYLPADASALDVTISNRLCWARLRVELLQELEHANEFRFSFDEALPSRITLDLLDKAGVGFGSRYLKRHRESEGKRVGVSEFISASLIEAIQTDPESISKLSKTEFESLCAELFVSRGYEVDLYRASKDDGIDFLAVKTDELDPMIFAVQCKHPEAIRESGKGPRTLPVATVREIYGVAKAHNLTGGIAITSAGFSLEAKRFAELQPSEIMVHDRNDVLQWVEAFRWNDDEPL